ncbi:putative cytosolic sulfotransferase 7-like isoform X1 [Capsicum annuum]|nr:putative cytosolic sulfotransferase 7-like isoform X1 [Capsicum annuum]
MVTTDVSAIPPLVAVGAGAKDFITAILVKFYHNARHDIKNWKGVPDLAKDRIVTYMLDKVKDAIAEKVQEIEDDTDMDPIINVAFVQVVGEKLKYILDQGSGIKSSIRISRNEIQEQLKAHQKEPEDERRKRENVESKLMEVKNQLEGE